jgi:S-methylmethionine-dependent homocysteine/selenocysteine methylase
MANGTELEQRIGKGEVIILDGAVGTQLQRRHVPMNHIAWAGAALETHPYTVQRMHEDYVKAGVDIITTNTFSSARHNLEPIALGDHTYELNLRAVVLAQQAVDRCARDRPVYIAGAVSCFGLKVGDESDVSGASFFGHRTEISVAQAKTNLREQAEILVEAGVDLLLVEVTGGSEHRRWAVEACAELGVPMWVGMRCRQDPGDAILRLGYCSSTPLEEEIREIMALGGSAIAIFHSTLEATAASIPVVKENWPGPIALYPEADRQDYIQTHRDHSESTRISPHDFVDQAKEWVAQGAQIIGGCCGVELEHIAPLRESLPARIPMP